MLLFQGSFHLCDLQEVLPVFYRIFGIPGFHLPKKTKGVKVACSTSIMRWLYVRFFPFHG